MKSYLIILHNVVMIFTILLLSCDIGTEPGTQVIHCDLNAVCTNSQTDEWTFLGLGGEDITAITVHPCNARVIFAGSMRHFSEGREGKIFRSLDCGETWDTVWVGGTITRIVVDPTNPDIIYANPHGVIRSMDGGTTWEIIDDGIHFPYWTKVITLDIDPENPRRLYAGTGGTGTGYLYYTDDRGNTWQPIPGYLDENRTEDDNWLLHNNVISFAIYPDNPNIMYAGTARRNFILKSVNRGLNWEKILDTDGTESTFAFSTDNNLLYIYIRDYGLIKSQVNENNWVYISIPDSIKHVGIPDNSIVYNEYKNLIVATGNGIYKFTGSEWLDYTDNLEHRHTIGIGIGQNSNIYVGISTIWGEYGGLYVRRIK
jgi:hypothetical protein